MKKIILATAFIIGTTGSLRANPIPPIRIEYINAFPPQIGVMIYFDSLSIVGDTIFTTSGSAIIGEYDLPGPYEMVILDSSNTTGFVISNESDMIRIISYVEYINPVWYGIYAANMPPIRGQPIILSWCDPHHHGGGWPVWCHEFISVDYSWTHIVINEVSANCTWGPESNFIELYNQSDSAIDLGGWRIICDTICEIPQNSIIDGHGFYFIDQSDFPDIFDLDYQADNIYLVRADSTLVDQVGWSSDHGTNVSFMRYPDGDVDISNYRQGYMGYDDGSSYTFENGFPTRGAPNRHESPGFVVIGTCARGDTGVVEIGWTNPIWDPLYDYSVVVGNLSHFPQDPSDGYMVYQGTEQQATDIGLPGNAVIHYTIFARDINGNYSVPTAESRVFVIMGAVGVTEEGVLPHSVSGLECYPNPFNASVTINFVLNRAGSVTLSIYNLQGQRVETLMESSVGAGEHRVNWNGFEFPSGVYFARLQAGGFSKSVKMLLLK